MYHNTYYQQPQITQYKDFSIQQNYNNYLQQPRKQSPHRLDYKTPPHKLSNCVLFKKIKKNPEQIKSINFKISFGNLHDQIEPLKLKNQLSSIVDQNTSKQKQTPTSFIKKFLKQSSRSDSKKLNQSYIKKLLKQLLNKIQTALLQLEQKDYIDKLQRMIGILLISESKQLKKNSFIQKSKGSKCSKQSSRSPKKQIRINDVQIEMLKVEKKKKQADKINRKQKQIKKYLKYLETTTKK